MTRSDVRQRWSEEKQLRRECLHTKTLKYWPSRQPRFQPQQVSSWVLGLWVECFQTDPILRTEDVVLCWGFVNRGYVTKDWIELIMKPHSNADAVSDVFTPRLQTMLRAHRTATNHFHSPAYIDVRASLWHSCETQTLRNSLTKLCVKRQVQVVDDPRTQEFHIELLRTNRAQIHWCSCFSWESCTKRLRL